MPAPNVKDTLRMQGKNANFFETDVKPLREPTRRLFEVYSGLAPDQVVPHILAVRDKAWAIWPYPCLGRMNFLDLSLSLTSAYPEILKRLIESQQTLLDLGCCFAQDIRKLVADGAPSENLYGVELRQPFVDLGYEMFRDEGKLKTKFIVGSLLNAQPPEALLQLEGKINIVYAGSIFHLFNYEDQFRLAMLVARLLRPIPGALLLGRQRGNLKPGEYEHRTDENTTMFRHDEQSFIDMWSEVGRQLNIDWDVNTRLLSEDDFGVRLNMDDRRLYFEVRRK